MTNLEKFVEANKAYKQAKTKERNTRQALTGNLPKHKLKKYESVVLSAHINLRNAGERLRGAYNNLSTQDKFMVDNDV